MARKGKVLSKAKNKGGSKDFAKAGLLRLMTTINK